MADSINPRLLERMPLFKDLTTRQLLEAAELMEQDHVPAGTVLMQRNAPGEAIFIIKSGAVKVCATAPDGELSVVHLGGHGEVYGEMSVVDGRTRSATVVTLEPSTVYRIEREDFWTTMWEMPPVPYNLACLLNRRLRLVTEQMQALKHLDARGRVVRQVASLFEEWGKVVADTNETVLPFVLHASDVASLVGAPQQDTESILQEWVAAGTFRVDPLGHLRTRDLNAIG